TDRPFDAGPYPWEPADEPATAPAAGAAAATRGPGEPALGTADEHAVGHKRDEPAGKVVTTAPPRIEPVSPAVKPAAPSSRAGHVRVDYAFLRQQISMERVLAHLGLLGQLRGAGEQRRGPCPLHSHPAAAERTFAVNLSKNIFRYFHSECAVQGNVLDLWSAVHRLPRYQAALHRAETLGLPRSREDRHGGNWSDEVLPVMYGRSLGRPSGGLFRCRHGRRRRPRGATSVHSRTTSRPSGPSGERPHPAGSDGGGPTERPASLRRCASEATTTGSGPARSDGAVSFAAPDSGDLTGLTPSGAKTPGRISLHGRGPCPRGFRTRSSSAAKGRASS